LVLLVIHSFSQSISQSGRQSGVFDLGFSWQLLCRKLHLVGVFVALCKFMDVLVAPVTSILGIEESWRWR